MAWSSIGFRSTSAHPLPTPIDDHLTPTGAAECSIYDSLARAWSVNHPGVHLEWFALCEPGVPSTILLDDGEGEAFYALRPLGDIWEFVSMRGAGRRLLTSSARVALAVLATGEALLFSCNSLIN